MPDTQERGYPQLEQKCDEQLRQILREDASKPEGEDTDMELILHVMEVLATRRKERGEGKSPAEALDSFNQKYCTDKESSLISEKAAGHGKKQAFPLWKRMAAVAAAFVLVIAFTTVNASAWEFDLWEIISQWSAETFRFWTHGEEPAQNTGDLCASLQAALDQYGITQKLVPRWLPDGYVESEVDIMENPKQRIFFASYQRGAKEIMIRITDYLGKDSFQAEQSSTLIDVYESAGIQYYIFENKSSTQIAWTAESYECFIQGHFTLEEVKRIIDSIEKG